MKRRRRNHGFTLLELLVATAMIGALGLALYTSMAIAFRARTTAHAQVRAMREASIVIDIAQQDFQSLLPPSGTLKGPFIGEASGELGYESDAVHFYALGRDTTGDLGPLSDGVRRVELLLVGDAASGTLVRRVERNLLAQVAVEPTEEVLARNVTAFTVRYFDGYEWMREWDSTLEGDVLPLAVEMTIVFDAPAPHDPTQPYRVMHVIPLACGVMADPFESLGALP